jgi:hypothetical protein
MLLALALASVLVPQTSWPADKAAQSAHMFGPNGLEGWTLDSPVPGSGYGDERFAFTLVVARHGRIIRKISGQPIIWNWIFWADGRDVAYETGPFHLSDACILIRVSDGGVIDSYDCYSDRPPTKPDWVKALEARQ